MSCGDFFFSRVAVINLDDGLESGHASAARVVVVNLATRRRKKWRARRDGLTWAGMGGELGWGSVPARSRSRHAAQPNIRSRRRPVVSTSTPASTSALTGTSAALDGAVVGNCPGHRDEG